MELEDVAPRFRMQPEAVRRILTRSGVAIRKRTRGPAKRQGQQSSEHGPPARKGIYPINLVAPPPGRTWCGQCERLVTAREAARCRSSFCKAKEVA
jgi:hypothetical protein